MGTEEDLDYIGAHLDGIRHYNILGGASPRLAKVDRALYEAEVAGQRMRRRRI
jgi:hypothetical protein